MAQPVKIIARWPGKGDLTIIVDGEFVWLAADDVERLAGVPAWGAGETVLADDWPEVRDGVAFYAPVTATAKARQAGGALGAAFADWLDATLPDLVAPDVVDDARPSVSLVDAVTVQHAARILTERRGEKVTRKALFELLSGEGWLERVEDGFRVLAPAQAGRWAAIHTTPHQDPARGRHALYRQPYITPAGLDELARLLDASEGDR